VVVRPAGDKAETIREEHLGKGLRIFDNLALVFPERLGLGLLQGHRLCGDDVHQGSALHSRKDLRVQGLGEVALAEDQSAAGTAQGLMGGHRDELAAGHRRRMKTGGDQTADMGDVGEDEGPDLIGNDTELFIIDRSRVGACADDDHLRAVALR